MEWRKLSKGIEQRVRALNAFLNAWRMEALRIPRPVVVRVHAETVLILSPVMGVRACHR